MELPAFRELLAPVGQAALAAAAGLQSTDDTFLSCFEKLRKQFPASLAKTALEQAILRVRARSKFAAADRMYFTREALEQATSEAVAAHRAQRFAPFGAVADLCCGIGGDALALAAAGPKIHAVESDSVRLAMARANAAALGLDDRIEFHEADALTVHLPDVHAAFADPDRRSGNRRFLDPEAYSPPLSALRARFAWDFPLAIKAAPGVALEDIARLGAEVEFVSSGGELKECVLWFGPLRSTVYRASQLGGGPNPPAPFPKREGGESSVPPSLLGKGAGGLGSSCSLFAESPPPLPPIVEPREYVFDPDSAVVRAGLSGLLAEQLDLAPIDFTVAMLTGPAPIATPFATAYRVEAADRFHLKRLREYLRAHGVGRITIIKRGSMIDSEDLRRKLKLAGSEHRVVFLTRAAGEQAMIVCERLTASSA